MKEKSTKNHTVIRNVLVWGLVILLITPVLVHFGSGLFRSDEPQDLELFPSCPQRGSKFPETVSLSSGGRIVGVTGCWNADKPPSTSGDNVMLNLNTPFYIRFRDFDGWILRRGINGVLDGKGILDAADVQEGQLKAYWKYRYDLWIVKPESGASGKTKAVSQKALDAISAERKLELEQWGAINRDKIGRIVKSARENVFPVINGVCLTGLKPVSGHEIVHPAPDVENPVIDADKDSTYDFYFEGCAQDPKAREVLESIAKQFSLWRPVKVGLGVTVNGRNEEAISLINHPFIPISKSQSPDLVIAPIWKFIWLATFILVLFACFIFLCLTTNILKAKGARIRPTGALQWSLSHFQFALWFLVIFLSYFYLWVLTGDLDQLNSSAVILSGIALATAIGGQTIEQLTESSSEMRNYNQGMEARSHLSDDEIIALIRTQLKEVEPRLNSSDQAEKESAYRDYEEYRRQLQFLSLPKGTRWLADLLSENGEITLHRFQMLAWTLGIAALFIFQVAGELKMPKIPSELLALMGLSAGTYLGFRIPEANRIEKTLLGKTALEKEQKEQQREK